MAVDACTILAYVRDTPPPVPEGTSQEIESPPPLREQLLLPDPLRSDLVLVLVTNLGCLAADRGRWVLDNQRVGAWLRLTHWEQMSLLFTSWREMLSWNDLRRTPGLVSEGGWTNNPLLPRRALLGVLRRLDGKAWYRVSDLVGLVKKADPDFQRPDGNYSGWYVRDAAAGHYLSGFESWDLVEGRLLRFLIEGPLFWLGAIALLMPRPETDQTFRLTPAGSAWLSSRMPQNPPQPARLAVSDDFTVSTPLLTPLLDRFRLARFTEAAPVGGWERRRDASVPGPTKHRITRASLARGREGGLKPEDAVAFLRRAAGGRVPARVVAAIERYGQLGGHVRIHAEPFCASPMRIRSRCCAAIPQLRRCSGISYPPRRSSSPRRTSSACWLCCGTAGIRSIWADTPARS